jgi:hypothetical protein
MNTQQGSTQTATGMQPSSGRTAWISAAVFAACLALYIAEQHGFRIFDESVHTMQAAEAGVPSPLEILTLLGTTSLGVCAGLVSLISCITWLVRRVRHATGHDYTGATTTGCAAQQSAS